MIKEVYFISSVCNGDIKYSSITIFSYICSFMHNIMYIFFSTLSLKFEVNLNFIYCQNDNDRVVSS